MEKSVGEDPSLALRMTRRTGSGWQGIPGRAGNDGDESWNDGGENNGKDKEAKGFPVEPGMTETRAGMTGERTMERTREQRDSRSSRE